MIALDEFKKYIEIIQSYEERDNKISELLDTEGFIMYSSKATNVILKLLSNMFDDKNKWIEYFIYELDYGKQWTPDSCTYADDTVINMGTIEELYKFLKFEMGEKD